jgi:DMSO/TMAO reductase YedYZ molybdopterin-dependent catalytic subunit
MATRRRFLRDSVGALALVGGAGTLWAPPAVAADMVPSGFATLPAGAIETGDLEALPGKLPLIKRSWRPPNYETPLQYFADDITPNRAFFVRYHLSNIPEVAAASWQLSIGGESAATPLTIALDALKREYAAAEVTAVCQCSGSRRGLFDPHVAGVEWGAGAIGNARWKGARLKDVLAKAGVKSDALEVVFDGADGAVIPATPDFQKSIPIWKALDENTLIAWEMNGEALPHWNGFPARIVVPGWTATYWMKHVTSIRVVPKPFDGFWVKSAYRIPRAKFPIVERFNSQETDANTPITEMVVNSLITNLATGQKVAAGRPLEIRGIAWDGGYGIAGVDVSTDGGRTWQAATLGTDRGRFSFRSFSAAPTVERGTHVVMARANNRAGATQTAEVIANPAGYHHNAMQRIAVEAA